MPIIFSHISALEILRLQGSGDVRLHPASSPKKVETTAQTIKTLESCGFCFSQAISQPIHLATMRSAHPHSTKGIHFHPQKPLPPKTLLGLQSEELLSSCGEKFFVSSPELCFLQMGSSLNLLELIQLGYELCGSYSLSKTHPNGFFARNPLTTVSRIKTMLDKTPGTHHIKKARRALSYILPSSASPRETSLAMLLCLPGKLGGYHLGKPTLNHPIDTKSLPSQSRRAKHYRCDLYWPDKKIAVEYDSDQFHTGAHSLTYDTQRRNRLLASDCTVITFTRKDLNNLDNCNEMAHILARRLGIRIRPRSKSFFERQLELRRVVLRNSYTN